METTPALTKLQGFCLYSVCTYLSDHCHILSVKILKTYLVWIYQELEHPDPETNHFLGSKEFLLFGSTRKETGKTAVWFVPIQDIVKFEKGTVQWSESQEQRVREDANTLSALLPQGESKTS